ARERPNAPSMPWTFPARRISQKSRPMNRTVGKKLTSRLSHHGEPVSSGCALTTTALLWRSSARASVLANDGISVLNFVVALELWKRSGRLNVPWIAVPFDVISETFPSRICCRKNGLYGTRTRDGACVALEPAQ